MSRITNINDSPLTFLNFELSDNEISGVVQVRIVPANRYLLKVSPTDADVEVQAREHGSGDPFVDIGASPIDLSSYAPETPVDFDLRAVASSSLVGVRRVVAYLSVSSNGAAGW